MNQPNPFARLDLLIHRLCGEAVRQYVEPQVGRQLWENGLDRVVAQWIARAGVPQQPVTHVRLGNLAVPIDMLHFLGQACGLLPGRELPPAGS